MNDRRDLLSGLRWALALVTAVKVPPPETAPREVPKELAQGAWAGGTTIRNVFIELLEEEINKIEAEEREEKGTKTCH